MPYPIIPDSREATRIENLASAISIGSEKDSRDMNMDMVNPIPPSQPQRY